MLILITIVWGEDKSTTRANEWNRGQQSQTTHENNCDTEKLKIAVPAISKEIRSLHRRNTRRMLQETVGKKSRLIGTVISFTRSHL